MLEGPQQPTWMEEREQTLWAPLWWAQLDTEQRMLLLAFMRSFMGSASFEKSVGSMAPLPAPYALQIKKTGGEEAAGSAGA